MTGQQGENLCPNNLGKVSGGFGSSVDRSDVLRVALGFGGLPAGPDVTHTVAKAAPAVSYTALRHQFA